MTKQTSQVVIHVSFLRLKNLPGGHSAVEPPDPMPNSEVKRGSADGSVAFAMRE